MLKQPPPYLPSQKPPPPTQSSKLSPPPLHPPPKPPPPSAYKSSLTSPAYLQQGQSIKSQSGNAILIMQHDGNLALNQINADNTSTNIWSAAGSNGIYFALQNDGGLVVYGYDNYTCFDSGTESMGIAPYTLTVYDYYIELTDKNKLKIWNNNAGILYKNVYRSAPSSIVSTSYLYANTQTALMSASKNTVLIMQYNGALVLYQINADNTSTNIWQVGAGYGGIYCALQNDGELVVVYDADNDTCFDSGTESMGIAPYTLTVYDYYIELTDKNKLKIWNNNAGILYKNVYPSAPSSIASVSYLYANTQTALMSASKNTVLIMQSNRDLVLYQINADNTVTQLWHTGTQYDGGYDTALLSNGALVVYDSNNVTWWDSGTENMGTAPYTLTVYDYYIELTDKNKLKIWNNNAGILYKNVYRSAPSSIVSTSYLYANTQTALMSASKNTVLIMQYNGALVLYQINADNTSTNIWETGTQNYPGYDAALLSNGGLVVYDANNDTIWDSNTENKGNAPYTLTVYDYNIKLTDTKKTVIFTAP